MYLGHASLKSTETYTRRNPLERLQILASRVQPRIRKGKFMSPTDPLMAMLGELKLV